MTDASAVPYKNRRGGLIFFGLVELGLGAMCLLLFGFSIFAFILAANVNTPGVPSYRPVQMIPSLGIYLVGGIVLAILGIGSIMARRWARDLSLIVAWAWLIFGVLTTVMMVVILPRVMPQLPSDQGPTMTFMLTCVTVVSAFFGIVVPLALVLFYRSPNVRATVLALDPQRRWTEAVPLPLLGLALWMAFSAISMAGAASYAVLPLGRNLITGPIAVGAYLAMAAFFVYLSWGLYKRSLVAWWLAIGWSVAAAIYGAFALTNLDYDKMLAAMKIPKTPGMPDMAWMYRSPWLLGLAFVGWALYLGYFLFVRRYFSPRNP